LFTIAEIITFTKAVMDVLKPERVNSNWKNLFSELVNDFNDFLEIFGEAEKVVYTAR
jgi:hypothetical protein